MIVQNVSAVQTSRTDISFTLPKTDGHTAMETLDALKADVGFDDVLSTTRLERFRSSEWACDHIPVSVPSSSRR